MRYFSASRSFRALFPNLASAWEFRHRALRRTHGRNVAPPVWAGSKHADRWCPTRTLGFVAIVFLASAGAVDVTSSWSLGEYYNNFNSKQHFDYCLNFVQSFKLKDYYNIIVASFTKKKKTDDWALNSQIDRAIVNSVRFTSQSFYFVQHLS